MSRKLTTAEFKVKAIARHGDLYDYSLAEYVGASKKIKIICRVHGVFEQNAIDHTRGKGCLACRLERLGDRSRSNTQDCTKKFRAAHGDLYDYSLVYYVGCKKKVKIICSVHGVFEQTPLHHIRGCGCLKCGYINSGTTQLRNQEWISKAISKHGDKYDYSLSEYSGCKSKVKIICKIHGVFLQTPDEHVQGKGCRSCGNSRSGIATSRRNWNPNLTDEHREHGRALHNVELKIWRGSVFGRDNSTCQCCRKKDKTIQAHHILPWSKFPEVRFDVDNGITFCQPCHKKYHSRYKLAECNHKTIAEFLSLDLIETA